MSIKSVNSRGRKVLLLIIILLLFVTAGLAWFIFHNHSDVPQPSPTPAINTDGGDVVNGEIPVGDYAATLAALQKKVDASRFEVKCNSSISRDPKTGKYNLMIGNTARNRYNCYIEINSKADNSVLYRSPVMKPGQYIASADINKPISGTINASANFIILDPKTNAYMGKVVVAVTIQNQTEAGQP